MKTLITGGCGFIGCNTADRFLKLGHEVTLLDNLCRPGGERNLQWIQSQGQINFVQRDIREAQALVDVFKDGKFDICVHLAGQVAVTTSVVDPRLDFEVNALGAFNVLEAIRQYSPATIFLNASTNKVYGKLPAMALSEMATRYLVTDLPDGVAETQPLDFHSPYGCSKGTADQYAIDYARIYGLRTVNFRQSCIYGYRQFGVEDQGWVAWFTIAHALGQPVTIYGNGKQVRDLLFVDDLIDGYLAAIAGIDAVAGQTFNIGGGPDNTLSLLELLGLLQELSGRAVVHSFDVWRPGDQPVYVSDIRKAGQSLSWRPRIAVAEGVARLYQWVNENRDQFLPSSAHA